MTDVDGEDFGRWAEPSFWLETCPWMTISDLPFQTAQRLDPAPGTNLERERQLTEGYLRFDDLFAADTVEPIRQAVETLDSLGLPTPFVYAFDEVWKLYASAESTLEALVGEDFLVGGDLWAWHLPPGPSSSGWGPHRDDQFANEGFNADGNPTHISLWVALSDADETNGCMYVLPKDQSEWHGGSVDGLTLQEASSVRALPASAGTLLSWTSDVLHWGGKSTSRAQRARTSICLYAQRNDYRRLTTDMVGLSSSVPFVHRLGIISRALIRYRRSALHPDLVASDGLLAFATEHEQRFQKWLAVMHAVANAGTDA